VENGPSPDADFQPIRLVSFALTVQTAAAPDPCLSERPGLACDALPGVGTSDLFSTRPLNRLQATENGLRRSDVSPRVDLRLWACLAILQAANAMKAETIGPTSARGVKASMSHKALMESLGPPDGLGWSSVSSPMLSPEPTSRSSPTRG